MDNPDSPDSISSDQLTVDLLSPRGKRRHLNNEIEERRDLESSQDPIKNSNNDVGFVLMDEDRQENGDNDEEVGAVLFSSLNAHKNITAKRR